MNPKTIILNALVVLVITACGNKNNQSKTTHSAETTQDCHDEFIKTLDNYSYTALGLAIRNGDLNKLKELIKNGVCTERCMSDEIFEYDALTTAVFSEQTTLVKYFIDAGMNADRLCGDAITILGLACAIENRETAYNIAKLLLDAGANVNGAGDVGAEDIVIPLVNAADRGNVKLVKLLIDRGADIAARNNGGNVFAGHRSAEIDKVLSAAVLKENRNINSQWLGDYSLFIEYGEIADGASAFVGYDLHITKDSCIFSAEGYQTWYDDFCLMREKGNELYIIYMKGLREDNMPSHKNENTLATFIRKNDKYYIKSPVVYDQSSNNDVELVIKKK